MSTYSESIYQDLKERHERYVSDYVYGTDSVDVLRARLHGLGFRGQELSAEVNLAIMAKAERLARRKA